MIERRLLPFAALALGSACAAERPAPQPVFAEAPRGSPLRFAYATADSKGVLSADGLRGRPTVLSFLTTYDLASQAQARFLTSIVHRHKPRINAAIVFLEPSDNRTLVIAFRDALRLDYYVAMADPSLISGEGPFGDMRAVPSTVVLDPESRLVWRHVGLAKEEEIERALSGL